MKSVQQFFLTEKHFLMLITPYYFCSKALFILF